MVQIKTEFFLNTKKELIPYKEWEENIVSLKSDEHITDEKIAVHILKKALQEAVKKRLPKKRFGILFSGGVDSTLLAFLCKKFTGNFICYTVGLEASKDILFSQKVAKYYGFKHKIKILSLKEAEQVFEKTAKILGKQLINIVNIGVGGVEVAAKMLAEKDKVNTLFSGLGSEEIFAGYQRHEKALDLNEECWNGLKTMWERDLKRDINIANSTKAVFLTPFLDKNVIFEAMKIDSNLKLKREHKKYILRKVAYSLGLKKEFAFRPKVAAQYGSNFDKAIMKITKQKAFTLKRDYLTYLSKNNIQ